MSLTYTTREELQDILTHLDNALHNHLEWYKSLVRILVCRLPGNAQDMKPQSHRLCLLGQWYYKDAPKKLMEHPGFENLGITHKLMHQLAAQLLQTMKVGNSIDPHEFDIFSNTLERLQLEFASLKQEVEILLYTHDPLTGAINRTNLLPTLRGLQEMNKRELQTCSLTMMDLDLFKVINDNFGHPAGDVVLASVARYMSEHLRSYDKLFRYGGEEFLICMLNTDKEVAYKRIEVLRKDLAKQPINIGKQDPVYITASFGISNLDSDLSIDESIESADRALYEAKTAGRNCTRVWDTSTTVEPLRKVNKKKA